MPEFTFLCPFAALERIEALARFCLESPIDTAKQASLQEVIHLSQELSNDLDVGVENV